MKKLKSLVQPLLCLLMLSLFYSSCEDPVPGCNDEQAENFDSAATENDGSCTYARTKFLGNYIGPFTCSDELLKGVLDSDSLRFQVKEAVEDDKSLILLGLIIEGIPVDLEGTVMGNNLVIKDTFNNFAIPEFPLPVGNDTILLTLIADVIGDGTALLSSDGEMLSGTLDLTITATDGSLSLSDSCDLTGEKVE